MDRNIRTQTPIDQIQWHCGEEHNPGIDEVPEWQDWSNRPSTLDQLRIEQYLSTLDLSRRTVLHVGIGNSEFAEKICEFAASVDGITIQPAEVAKAQTFNLRNYRAFLLNKFSPDLCQVLGTRYDYIVEVNPTGFTCCRYHFFRMMQSYRDLLQAGGSLLTDRIGLKFTSLNNNPAWSLLPEHWKAIAGCLDLEFEMIDPFIIALVKPNVG